jgi:deoxyribodipyrimidine photolyase-related protein
MKEATLCFPNQLFEINPSIAEGRDIYLIEDSLFFGDFECITFFHKKKLVLHRASMKYYEDFLKKEGFNVIYLDYQNISKSDPNNTTLKALFELLNARNIEKIHYLEPVDLVLESRLEKFCKFYEINRIIYENPGFFCSKAYIENFFKNRKRYLQTSFYIEQRKRMNILIENGKPVGGKWTYDKENRKKIPKDIEIPKLVKPGINEYLNEALKYVSTKFSENLGRIDNFCYPVTHKDAIEWFNTFLVERFHFFGPYEDAIEANNHLLFHSLLSPILNIGLITPHRVIKQTLNYAKRTDIPLNSLEGFIRQIIGWREFIRAIYIREGAKQRDSNYWQNKRKLPNSFYNGTTGILPIDNLIKSLINTGYLHHIERLMLLGNFMNLCEIASNEIYRWFMEFFIDAYDWVMVPNVYGMSLNADGGLITTKPYISSSNYIKKMSNYPSGRWNSIWDGLYWRFINKHKEKIKKNPRMSMMINILNKMNAEKLLNHIETAENFLSDLFK